MLNKRGMVLIEALLLFMICALLVSILVVSVLTYSKISLLHKRGFQDDLIQAIYEEE
ncbi:MAG: hypothetical protein RR537_06920 [Longicatena sp.]